MKTPNKNWTFYMQSPQVGCMCRGHHNVGSLTVSITRVTFSQNHKLFPCDKNSKPWMRAHILTSRCHAKQWRLLKVLRSGVCSHVIMGLSHTPRHGPELFFRRRLSCWDGGHDALSGEQESTLKLPPVSFCLALFIRIFLINNAQVL